MRTTVSISDDVLSRARRRAAERGVTLSVVVEEALRRDEGQESRVAPPVVEVFRGGTGPRPGVDLTSNAALADLLDEDLPADRRR